MISLYIENKKLDIQSLYYVFWVFNMFLNEKIQYFLEERAALNSTGITLNREVISKLGIKGSLRKIIFEPNVSVESEVISSSNNSVFFGMFSYMNSGGYIRANVFIGRYCSIGRRVTIGAGMHSFDNLSSHPLLDASTSYSYEKTTVIHSDVWIGDGAIIMPGVSIGKGSIIGANAVVTKDVPPYEIWGGVPARKIRDRFSNQIIENLIQINWEDYPLEILKESIKSSKDILGTISFLKSLGKENLVHVPNYYIVE